MPCATAVANYCGLTFLDASKCSVRCPRGVDAECPSGERCYANVDCHHEGDSVTDEQQQQPVETQEEGEVQQQQTAQGNALMDEDEKEANGNDLTSLEVVGIVLGIVAALVSIAGAACACWKEMGKKKKKEHSTKEQGDEQHERMERGEHRIGDEQTREEELQQGKEEEMHKSQSQGEHQRNMPCL